MASAFERLADEFEAPGLDLLESEAVELAGALSKKLSGEFVSVGRGFIYSEWLPQFHSVSIRLFRKPEMAPRVLDRECLCRLLCEMKGLLEYLDAKIDVTLAEETNPIDGTIIAPRTIVQKISFQELFETRLQVFTGEVEAVRFSGYYKTKKASILRIGDVVVEAKSIYSGLYVPASFSFYGHTEYYEERLEDRLVRMKQKCCEGDLLDVCRNINGLLNPSRLLRHFNEDPAQFPEFQSREDLYKCANDLRDSLRDEIKACARKDNLATLMEVALRVVPDDDIEEYVLNHLRLRRMTRATLNDVVQEGRELVSKHGWAILQQFRSPCQAVLPSRVVKGFLNMVDCIFEFETGNWSFEFLTGIDSVALDGDETVYMVQLKHCNKNKLLQNLGLEISENLISWKADDQLTSGQREIRKLAEEMCFNTIVPIEVLQGTKSMRDATINLYRVSPDVRQQHYAVSMAQCLCGGKAIKGCSMCDVPLQDFLSKSGCLPMAPPSISPSFASSALAFVTPVVARDLPGMVNEARRLGQRIGFGTLFLSKHLERAVMAVLNPTQQSHHAGRFVRKPASAFEKSRQEIVLPHAPGGLFRWQGQAWAKGKRRQLTELKELPTDLGRRLGRAEIVSASSRPTRSTGDLPRTLTANRRQACDRPHRQPLLGHVRADGFHRHRASTANSASTQHPTQLHAREAKDLSHFEDLWDPTQFYEAPEEDLSDW